MNLDIQIFKNGTCPKCSKPVEYEPCTILPKIVPLCDACAELQEATFAATQKAERWARYFASHIPPRYASAEPRLIPPHFRDALTWDIALHAGGLGLIGKSGAGKSSVLACMLAARKTPFLWWSGTEARDAAIEAATADKDREGASRRWEHANRVAILVLDDISQGKMTEAWSSRLFDLLETRLSGNLPTFWSSQITLTELKAKIYRQNSQDSAQADAISRRLGQHSLKLEAPPA